MGLVRAWMLISFCAACSSQQGSEGAGTSADASPDGSLADTSDGSTEAASEVALDGADGADAAADASDTPCDTVTEVIADAGCTTEVWSSPPPCGACGPGCFADPSDALHLGPGSCCRGTDRIYACIDMLGHDAGGLRCWMREATSRMYYINSAWPSSPPAGWHACTEAEIALCRDAPKCS